nr:hypothetical protein [Oricola nitratireducens]
MPVDSLQQHAETVDRLANPGQSQSFPQQGAVARNDGQPLFLLDRVDPVRKVDSGTAENDGGAAACIRLTG